MKKFSLKFKLALMSLIPFIAVLILGIDVIKSKLNQYQDKKRDAEDAELIDYSSNLIHQLQLERGKTVVFLNGGSAEELAAQRKNVDKGIEDLAAGLNIFTRLSAELRQAFQKSISDIQEFRKLVDSKVPAADAVKFVNKLIDSFISSEILAAYESDTFETLIGSIILDIGKESGGKLRATLANILSQNKAISNSQALLIQEFNSGFISNTSSPTLKLNSESAKKMASIKESKQWSEVQRVFQIVADRAEKGEYNEDPKNFFANITWIINELRNVVSDEMKFARETATQESAAAKSTAWVYATVLSIFFIIYIISSFAFVRTVTKQLQETVLHLNTSSTDLNNAFQQLRSASQQISSGATESASSLEQTVASLEEVNGMVANNASSLVRASDLANSSKKMAEDGERDVKHLIEAMKELSTFSEKIENIVAVIDDIAFQINLLALNAAVEAARAGEQGKGFAVVADAVRELAQKSATAAREIGSLITVSVEKTKKGAETADQNGAALTTILKSITDLALIVAEITRAGQEQAAGLGQINQAMNALDKSTQTNAASAEETSSSADALLEQSKMLQTIVTNLNEVIEGKHAA